MIDLSEGPNSNPAEAHAEFMRHIQSAIGAAAERGGEIPHHMRPPLEAWKLNFKCMAAAGSSPHSMLMLVRQMIKDFGMPPQTQPYLSVLRRCSQTSDGKLAFAVIREMESHELPLTFPVLGHAIEATIRSRDTGFAARLFEYLNSVVPNNDQMYIYETLALEGSRLFSRMHRYDYAFKLMEHTKLPTYVRAKILNDIIHRAGVGGAHKVLISCIDRMKKLREEATANGKRLLLKEKYMLIALRSAEAHIDVDLARNTWSLMQQNLLPDNEATDSSQTERHQEEEEDSASASLEDIDVESTPGAPSKKKGKEAVAPSVSSYKSYITALARGGEIKESLETVVELCETYPHVVENVVTQKRLPAVVDAIATPKKVDSTYYMLEEWLKQGPVPVALFNLVIAACSQLGDLGRAFQTFEQLPGLNLKPSPATYNALLSGCVATNNQSAFDTVMDRMKEDGVEPDAQTLHLLVDREVVAGDAPAMLQALTKLDDAGINPEAWLLERCVARCERAGNVDELETLLHRLKRATGSGGWRKSVARTGNWEKRWAGVEGGLGLITGSSRWVSRRDVKMQPRGKKP